MFVCCSRTSKHFMFKTEIETWTQTSHFWFYVVLCDSPGSSKHLLAALFVETFAENKLNSSKNYIAEMLQSWLHRRVMWQETARKQEVVLCDNPPHFPRPLIHLDLLCTLCFHFCWCHMCYCFNCGTHWNNWLFHLERIVSNSVFVSFRDKKP